MPVPTVPGFVDAHCHAFQRGLRGRGRGGDFWAWRDEMVALAASLTVEQIRREYTAVYGDLRANGYTAVGEFHYLGFEEARAAAEAAAEAGVELTLLYACYLRGGIPRFRQESAADYLAQLEGLREDGIRVGVAPHSVRACPAEALRELGRYAQEHGLPLHVHADEQPREIEECLAEHGLRPIELLAREECLGPAPRSSTRRTPTEASSTCSETPGRESASAPPPRRTSVTASSPSRASATARSVCASARTRTCASTRSRSCASSRESRGGRPAGVA